MSRAEAQKWAAREWEYAQEVAFAQNAKLEEKAANDRWLPGREVDDILDELRVRRELGLQRARQICSTKAAADGAVAIPALLLSARGSREEMKLLGYHLPPQAPAGPEVAPARQESDPDDRPVQEILAASQDGLFDLPTGALPTAAFPKSARLPDPVRRPYSPPRGERTTIMISTA